MKSNSNILVFYTKDDYLSNFYLVKFTHKRFSFSSSEQAIMWRKAKLFKADNIADQILKTVTPSDAKYLGRSRSIAFSDSLWEKSKLNIFKEVLLDKFTQNIALKTMLLSTGEKLLAEASPSDTIWGIGLDENSKDIFNPFKWKGQNLLGKTLMEVRKCL